jgi:transcriptional regulator with XRE-family HTH domain
MFDSLVNYRVTKKLSQKQIADKIGVSLSFYSKVELGLREPSYNFLVKFKQAFEDVDINQIFFNN